MGEPAAAGTAAGTAPGIRIAPDDVFREDVQRLLGEHLEDMHATSPAESVHALDGTELARPGITFWTARDADGTLLGCGALKELGPDAGELKSMRTVRAARGRGVGGAVLAVLVQEARRRGYATLFLETGTHDYFAAAHRLYARAGFRETGPFGDYTLDPHSVYLALEL